MQLFEALSASRRLLDDVLAAITPPDLDRPTPCDGWSVRGVANDVVGGAVRYRMLLDGAAAVDLDATRLHDHLQPTPAAGGARTGDHLEAGYTGDLTRVVHHPAGDRTAHDLLVMRVFEQALHGWDIGVGLGDPPELDPWVCRFLLDHLDLIENGRERGVYAKPADPAAPQGDPCTWLLVETGRGSGS